MSYSNLKNIVLSNINDNVSQDITPAKVRNTLNAMIDSLGQYGQFAGAFGAALNPNPGNPEQKVFYIVWNDTNSGVALTYFNNIVIPAKKSVIISNETGTWVSVELPFNIGEAITELMVEVTYSELAGLINNGELVAGQKYRITDYVTSVPNNIEAVSEGNQFDIIVTAIDESHLSEEAMVAHHTGDDYFINSNLDAWKIWYCLENDDNRFNWADTTNGKGVIYRMIDEFGNDVPYDFKNIKFDIDGYAYFTFNNSDGNDEISINGSVKNVTIKPWVYESGIKLNNIVFDLNGNEVDKVKHVVFEGDNHDMFITTDISYCNFEKGLHDMNLHSASNGEDEPIVTHVKNSTFCEDISGTSEETTEIELNSDDFTARTFFKKNQDTIILIG